MRLITVDSSRADGSRLRCCGRRLGFQCGCGHPQQTDYLHLDFLCSAPGQAGRRARLIPVAIALARSSTARLIAITTALSSVLVMGSVNAVCSEINVNRPGPSMMDQRATKTTS